MIGVGVIGYGYWGPNWVRNLAELPGARVAAVSDLREDRLAVVRARYPTTLATGDHRDLLASPEVDAVIVATPASSHFALAMEALAAGKHVLVEKPLSPTVAECERLIEEADRRGLLLMVDHTFVYTSAVRKIREVVAEGLLGPIYYYDSVRVNLGLIQHDVNVFWDLAVHDLAIMDHIIDEQPRAVAAIGAAHINGMEDVGYLTCFFASGTIAHIHVNWLAPVKVRRTLIGGANRMVVYDDLEPSEKVKIYDRGVTLDDQSEERYRKRVGYRLGDMWAPQLDPVEALRSEALHFLACIEGRERPLTDGRAGLRVIQILEAATRSLAQGGRPVELMAERIVA